MEVCLNEILGAIKSCPRTVSFRNEDILTRI